MGLLGWVAWHVVKFSCLVLVVLLVGLAVALAVFWEEWLRAAAEQHLTHKLSDTPVRILELKMSISRPTSVVMRDVIVGNGPGTWEAPYLLKLQEVKVTVASFLDLLSLPGLTVMNCWGRRFYLGFLIREIETIEVTGLSLWIEDADGDDDDVAIMTQ